MILRRALALILAGSLFHLSASRADAACAEHGERGAGMPQASGHAGEHHPGDAASDEECDTPTLPACCQMLASCSTIHIAADAVRQPVMQAHVNVAAAVQRAPESRVATPDPPPPKH